MSVRNNLGPEETPPPPAGRPPSEANEMSQTELEELARKVVREPPHLAPPMIPLFPGYTPLLQKLMAQHWHKCRQCQQEFPELPQLIAQAEAHLPQEGSTESQT